MKIPSQIDLSLSLQRTALLIFIFFIILASLAQILLPIRTWTFIKAVQFGLLAVIFLVPILLIFTSQSFWSSIEKFNHFSVLWMLAIAIGLRVVLIPLISTDFISDMEDIHLFAVDVYSGDPFANLNNYPNIPHATYLTLTGYVLSFVYKIFGASTAVAKFFLVLLGVLTAWLVYLTGRELGDQRTGFVASLLYASLPSVICYTGVLTGDHLALPLLVSVILIQAWLYKAEHGKPFQTLIWYAICGVLIGLIDWFRPVGMILLVAVVISLLLYQLRRRTIFQVALAFCVLVISYMAVSKVSIVITENIFQTKMLSTSEKIGAYLFVGLNPKSHGGVNLDDARTIGETYQQFGSDYTATNRYLIEAAFSRLKKGQLAKLLVEKFDLVWSSHTALFDYALVGSNDEELINLLRDFETVLYLVITLFILVNAIACIREKSNPGTFTMQVFILGFALLMLVFEVQNRYVIVAIPYSILLGVLGMRDAFSMRSKSIES